MRLFLLFAVVCITSLIWSKDVNFGGVAFRLPENGGGISVVENGKSTRLFHTNLCYSDDKGRRFLKIEWTEPNKIDKLDTLEGREAYRVTYPVKETDALQFSTVYRFFEGTPGVVATEEVLAVKPVRIHSWNMTGANIFASLNPDGEGEFPFPKPVDQKAFSPRLKAMNSHLIASDADGRKFFYDRAFKTLEGKIFYHRYPKSLSRTEGTLLEPGQSMVFTHTAGRVLANGDEEKISRLAGRALLDGRTSPVLVTRLDGKTADGGPDWSNILHQTQR